MLVLSRKIKEQIMIGDDIVITLLRIDGNKVRIGIDAPKDVRVIRAELSPVAADLSSNEPDLAGQPSEREGAFAHPNQTAVSRRRVANADTTQLFVGTVDRNGEQPRIARAPLAGFMTAS